MASKGKLVKVAEVSGSGAWSVLAMETALITLAHLALWSEEVEAEVCLLCYELLITKLETLLQCLDY